MTSDSPPTDRLPPRVRLMGMPIDPITERRAIGHILSEVAAGRGGWVITPNLDQLRLYDQRPQLREMYEKAELVVADGMPLLLAARIQGTPLPQRVAGSELIYTLTEACAKAGRSIFLLGGDEGVAERAAKVMRCLHPGLAVNTHYPPFGFEKSTEETRKIEEALLKHRPEVVFVGLGFPKQELLIERIRGVLPGAWFLGVGISFSFVSGDVKRAPKWLQKICCEWAHRMVQEPRRLVKRYVVEDLPFGFKVLREVVKQRRRRGWMRETASDQR